jgi:hypothetical protein
MCRCLIVVALLLVPVVALADRPVAQVVVLDTLHQLHAEVPAYSDSILARLIEELRPDVLCIEVKPVDLVARPAEKTKQEYPSVIYPLMDRHHYRVYAMEPAEPAYSALLKPYRQGNHDFDTASPSQSAALDRYDQGVYAGLESYWTSPSRVNDAVTDSVLRAKHDLQEAMIGPTDRQLWQAWNGHFLQVIERAARENPSHRIVVTVGAEHGYWLRAHLAHAPGLRLMDTSSLLRALRQRHA